MKLFFKKTGEGKPLLILHGLFGLGDNWSTLAKAYAENGFSSFVIDLRNHGRSPHSNDFNYEAMAEDVMNIFRDENISRADLIGHSMGGKTAMFFAAFYPEKINKMVIADMSPRFYAPHHQTILSALNAVDTDSLTTRKEAEEKLRTAISDEATVQFLLKNLYWKEDEKLGWRFGLKEIEKNISMIGQAFKPSEPVRVPVLFLRGERSGYINKNDELEIKSIFPNSEIKTISGAGHWIHAEKPKEFFAATIEFLNKKSFAF